MHIGIDVGGTSTDGVLLHRGELVQSVKKPSRQEDLAETILAVLDGLLEGRDAGAVRRLVISTTLVTNLLATQKGARTALILVPGRGLPFDFYRIAPDTYFLKGNIDFRGKVTEPVEEAEIERAVADIRARGIGRIAVAAKFSNRNRTVEQEIARAIKRLYPEATVVLGSETANRLNFPRRAVTAYYSAVTAPEWNGFADRIEEALHRRGLKAPVDILKADGGTMPLVLSRENPVETVFSGPAASAMGAVALSRRKENAVVIDIGGTTSDIALLIDGEPLHASGGALINGRLTHINALALRSLALGGDSAVKGESGRVEITAERFGPAACFGGPVATVSDAFACHRGLKLGEAERAREKIAAAAAAAGLEPGPFAAAVVEQALERLGALIQGMFREWENEPAYKVWEIVHRRRFRLDRLYGIGGAAELIVPLLADRLGVPYLVHRLAPVANALGTAVARPTLAVSLYADTQQKRYLVDREGIEGSIDNPEGFRLEEARKTAAQCLARLAAARGAAQYLNDTRVILAEQFNMIRGFSRVGKIFRVDVQIAPGLIDEFEGVAD
ncbi:MAG TPA: hydantoinase/oxoprolinase family protein [Bacillota bacterium]|nr:hydantoinase/oxoprolinase family protein [Bacillota bacterium]